MTPYQQGQAAYREGEYHNLYDSEEQPEEFGEWARGWQDQWLKEE